MHETSADLIAVKKLTVHAQLGVDAWEREREQPLTCSVVCQVAAKLDKAARSDSLVGHSLSYAAIAKLVAKCCGSGSGSGQSAATAVGRFKTVEALAAFIAGALLDAHGDMLSAVKIRLEKPRALLHARCAGVEITRQHRRPREQLQQQQQQQQQHTMNTTEKEEVEDHPTRITNGDLIFINELQLSTIIGINPWERTEKQRVIINIDVMMGANTSNDGPGGGGGGGRHSHSHPHPYDYRAIARRVTKYVEDSSFKTVEALVIGIARCCIVDCHVPKVRVEVEKPSALVFAEAAAIEITRCAADFAQEIRAASFDRNQLAVNSEAHIQQGGCYDDDNNNTATNNTANDNNNNVNVVAYIGFGSNVGHRAQNITRALQMLQADKTTTRVVDTSFLYESAPMYVTDQAVFLNGCAKLTTSLSPHQLMKLLQSVEQQLGRESLDTRLRNGPRCIDLDILFYNDLVLETEDLVIPHPRLEEREFVLRPLSDIAASFEHPKIYRSVGQLFALLYHKTLSSIQDEQQQQESIGNPTAAPILLSAKNTWRVMPIGDKIIRLENGKTLIMGILNMTPDSFSSDGKIMGTSSTPLTSGEIVEIVDKMIKNGADIIDIGGQSTRPGAEEVSEDEEIRRVAPVIAAIREAGLKHPLKYEYLAKIPLSVDTYRAGVAKAALDAGADMINDVTGGFGLVDFDEDLYLTGAAVATNLPESSQMVDLWIERQCPVCIMHMKGSPKTMQSMTSTYKHDIVTSISQSLKMRVNRALYGGSKLPHHLFRWNIIIDPGIGFAKTVDQNFKLLSHLRSLCIGTSMSEGIDGSSSSSLAVSTTITTFPSSNTASTSSAPELSQGGYFYTGFPILVGPSRKGFIGKTLGADDPKDSRRVWGTGAACTAAIAGGAAILRVHDVREMSDVVAVADKCFK